MFKRTVRMKEPEDWAPPLNHVDFYAPAVYRFVELCSEVNIKVSFK